MIIGVLGNNQNQRFIGSVKDRLRRPAHRNPVNDLDVDIELRKRHAQHDLQESRGST